MSERRFDGWLSGCDRAARLTSIFLDLNSALEVACPLPARQLFNSFKKKAARETCRCVVRNALPVRESIEILRGRSFQVDLFLGNAISSRKAGESEACALQL